MRPLYCRIFTGNPRGHGSIVNALETLRNNKVCGILAIRQINFPAAAGKFIRVFKTDSSINNHP